ncbi:MAG: hypothetical protein HRF40_03800 [Nitrososphaera sp.]
MEIKLRDSTAQSIMPAIRRDIADGTLVETPAADTIRVSSTDAQEMLVRIIALLSKNSVQIENVSINPPTLEEVFLSVIGRQQQA